MEIREDVQAFLDICHPVEKVKETEGILDLHPRESWEYYDECKNRLSHICGLDAGAVLYDQELYDTAYKKMVEILEI